MAADTLTEEQQRVRGYLRTQGEKYTWFELWRRLAGSRLELLDILDGVSEEQAAFVPAEGEWSIAEVAQHVAKGARSNALLVERLATGTEVTDTSGVEPPRAPAEMSMDELREELLLNAVEFAALPPRLPEPPSFELEAPHPFFGDLHCKAWYLFQRVHDVDHTGQIAAVKAADGYPAS
jgi:DinB superfamily